MLGGECLGGSFGKDEQHNSDADGGEEDAVFAPEGDRQRRSDSRGGGIDQIGAQQYVGEELFRVLQHAGHMPGALYPVADELLQFYPLQREKGGFRAAEERR